MRIIAIILLFLTGLNALAAGYSFIVEPDGKGIGIDISYLQHSPFDNFLIPGIVLFFAIGVLSIVAAVISLKKISKYYIAIISEGSILFGWIVIQVIMLQKFHIFHPICGVTGLTLIILGWLLWKKETLIFKEPGKQVSIK